MKETVLLIDDDPLVHKVIGSAFKQQGFLTLAALSGEEGLKLLRKSLPDLVILDLGLNDIGGLDLLGAIRNDKSAAPTPVIVLTGTNRENQDITCLDLGADDYVLKTYDAQTLLARARALLRRVNHGDEKAGVLRCREISIDLGRRAVLLPGRVVENLTPKEFDLLYALARSRPKVLSRRYLAKKIWGGKLGVISKRTIDVHVRRIRKKLGPLESTRIATVAGIGYKFLDA